MDNKELLRALDMEISKITFADINMFGDLYWYRTGKLDVLLSLKHRVKIEMEKEGEE